MKENIQVISSGEKWIGYGIRSFSQVIQETIIQAQKEIIMTIYIISDLYIVEKIKNALEKGIHIEILIYLPDSHFRTVATDRIFELESGYDYLRIHRIKSKILHAKVLVADGHKIVCGSANPTFGGMVKNYELGFVVDDGSIAQEILLLLRRLTIE